MAYWVLPLIVVPFFAYRFNDWHFLFGAFFSWIGSFSAIVGKFIFFAIVIFAGGWFVLNHFGIELNQSHIHFMGYCYLAGGIVAKIADSYHDEIQKNVGYGQGDEKHFQDLRDQLAERRSRYPIVDEKK
jgi:hypothetical protein